MLGISSYAQDAVNWGDWQTWGEQTDGTYRNPVIPVDYSDLDCIRVGNDYYAISSTMQFSPGMTILHSRDLVNWEIVGNAVSDLTQISPALGWQQMDRYGRGIWAGTLRYHRGRFYLFFGTPDEGFFMTTAKRAEGPWEPLTPLLQEPGWDDCSAIWDNDGQAWFVGTHFADGYKTYLFPMAKDGRSIDRSSARLVNEGNGREASKLIYHDGYYYLVFSEHRDHLGRYVMAKRDRKMTGRFSEERQLLLPCREANEPNQGGIIESPSLKGRAGGEAQWYFLTHHGHGDWSGRIVSLLPVEWHDGWPMMGDRTKSNLGTMVWQAKMPATRKGSIVNGQCSMVLRSDDFDTSLLAPQWQWNYQPRNEMWSLTERPGWMRLRAFKPLENDKLLKAGNTLTQRSFRSVHNEVIVKIDISHTADGLHAGLCHFAASSASLGIVNHEGTNYLEWTDNDHRTRHQAINEACIYLRSTWGLDGKSLFSYSLDGETYTEVGKYQLSWGFYRGDRIGIYCFNERGEQGYVDVDYLHYDMMRHANPFGRALVPDMIADASIQLIGDTFYCYATTDGYGRGLETSGPPVVWKSKDFVHWSFEGTYFPSASNEKYWAPSKAVQGKDGRWYIYPTVNGYMHVGVSDSPDGPFRLARGKDEFTKPYTEAATLLQEGDRGGIDTEVFIDDDGQAYVFWGRRYVTRLADDMTTVSDIRQIETRRKEYSEGPIFFKRNGIYYYLYTIGGDENYEYYYQMSRTSPLGPWEIPVHDLVSTTSVERGVFGPGHGCVFNVGDDYYFAFLEFSRNSTNRQTYVNRMEFNDDGTIRQVEVSLDGVGAIGSEKGKVKSEKLRVADITASSTMAPHKIRYFNDRRCQRTEYFDAAFAIDDANGSRWMAEDSDSACWLQIDLGQRMHISRSELCFVRPTAGHAYVLEGSVDGKKWKRCGGHADVQKRSPHIDDINASFRYLRVRITDGIRGVWEWRIL
jgi:beta-xylosidase